MIIFNYLAAGFVIVGLAVGYGIQSVTGQVGSTNILAASLAFIIMALIDAIYRGCNNTEESLSRFVLPSQGGQVMFLPVWLVASFMFVDNLVDHYAAS